MIQYSDSPWARLPLPLQPEATDDPRVVPSESIDFDPTSQPLDVSLSLGPQDLDRDESTSEEYEWLNLL